MHVYEVRVTEDVKGSFPISKSLYYSNLKKASESIEVLLDLRFGITNVSEARSYSSQAKKIREIGVWGADFRNDKGESGRVSIHKIQVY